MKRSQLLQTLQRGGCRFDRESLALKPLLVGVQEFLIAIGEQDVWRSKHARHSSIRNLRRCVEGRPESSILTGKQTTNNVEGTPRFEGSRERDDAAARCYDPF
jgi:hypothetical protein